MSSSSATLAPSSKSTRILACVLCQHRKIKCDRTFPCANCVKANVTCTPATPAPARKRRRPNQDLQERLARCEELLKQYATANPDSTPTQTTDHHNFDGTYLGWKPAGKLVVEDDGGVRFMDSVLLGTVYDELKAMREIIDDDDDDATSPDNSTNTPDDNTDLIMGGGDSPNPTSLEQLQPAPGHIFRLWQLYCERVNPLNKIIHVPTLQPYLVEATSGSQNVPKNIEALLFAIYTFATVTMTPDECLSLLGYSRDTALQRFSQGTRISLNRLGFLKSHDLETLQALLIYLCSLQGRYNQHAAWILNGVVIRIAQKMGLHRDGESLGLSPFETEMRRRVWWQIVMTDVKFSMLSGLGHSLLPRNSDTKLPKNINDADLFPSATEPIQDREGPTEMIMVLLTSRVAKFLCETPGFEPIILLTDTDSMAPSGGPTKEQLDSYRGIISELARNLLEIIDKNCDPSAGPTHEMAFEMKGEIMEKVGTLLAPPKERKYADELKTPSDNAFKVCVQTSEHAIDEQMKSKGKGFGWFARMHFQLNIFQFMVGQLSTRTSGELVEKAWETVQGTYDLFPELFEITKKQYFLLATFVFKAWTTREEVLRNRFGGTPEIPDYILRLRELMPQDEARSEPSSGTVGSIMSPADLALKGEGSTDPALDQLLGPYLDASTIDWDIWGNMVPSGSALTAFGSFSMGPNTEW